MGIDQAPTQKGKQASKSLHEAAKVEEKKVEAEQGKPLAKGAARFEERSKSSDGRSSGDKQQKR